MLISHRKIKDYYYVGSGTDRGIVREQNQDSIGFFQTKDKEWLILLVCDGVGGHQGGEYASQLAVSTISKAFIEQLGHLPPKVALEAAVLAAHAAILERGAQHKELKDMATTCAVLALKQNQAYIAHAGDSRIYRIRPNQVEHMTRDHSNVQRLVDSGFITLAEAKEHPENNILYQCLGGKSARFTPDVQGPIAVEKGDRFLLCSDGLHGLVEDRIIAALALMYGPQEAVEKLITLAIDRGGTDNISVQIAHEMNAHPPTKKFRPEEITDLTSKRYERPSIDAQVSEKNDQRTSGWVSRVVIAFGLLAVLAIGAIVIVRFKYPVVFTYLRAKIWGDNSGYLIKMQPDNINEPKGIDSTGILKHGRSPTSEQSYSTASSPAEMKEALEPREVGIKRKQKSVDSHQSKTKLRQGEIESSLGPIGQDHHDLN